MVTMSVSFGIIPSSKLPWVTPTQHRPPSTGVRSRERALSDFKGSIHSVPQRTRTRKNAQKQNRKRKGLTKRRLVSPKNEDASTRVRVTGERIREPARETPTRRKERAKVPRPGYLDYGGRRHNCVTTTTRGKRCFRAFRGQAREEESDGESERVQHASQKKDASVPT